MTNDFKGAVLVKPEKIKYAIGMFQLVYDYSWEYRYSIDAKTGAEVDSWGRFAKWFYRKKDTPFSKYMARYNAFMEGYNETYVRMGLMPKEAAQVFRNVNSQWSLAKELSELVKAGEPVYLGVELAQFVNSYGKNYD